MSSSLGKLSEFPPAQGGSNASPTDALVFTAHLGCLRSPLGSGKVETVEVHYLVPNRHKVIDELLLRVCTCVDLSQCAEFGM